MVKCAEGLSFVPRPSTLHLVRVLCGVEGLGTRLVALHSCTSFSINDSIYMLSYTVIYTVRVGLELL